MIGLLRLDEPRHRLIGSPSRRRPRLFAASPALPEHLVRGAGGAAARPARRPSPPPTCPRPASMSVRASSNRAAPARRPRGPGRVGGSPCRSVRAVSTRLRPERRGWVGVLAIVDSFPGSVIPSIRVSMNQRKLALAGATSPGTVTTMDALLTQRTLAAQIRRRGGHYLMVVKENQPALHRDPSAVHRAAGAVGKAAPRRPAAPGEGVLAGCDAHARCRAALNDDVEAGGQRRTTGRSSRWPLVVRRGGGFAAFTCQPDAPGRRLQRSLRQGVATGPSRTGVHYPRDVGPDEDVQVG